MSSLKRNNIYAVLGIILFICALYAPLFVSKIFFDGDSVTYDYPTFAFYKDAMGKGESLTWNPYYLGGYPLALSAMGNYFDPLNQVLLSFFHNVFTAVHIRFLISVLLGILFSFLFCRSRGLSNPASLIAGMSYLSAQTLTGMTSGLPNAGAFFVMPALLYLVSALASGKKINILFPLGVLIVGYGWLAGFIQTVFYAYVIAFAYALYQDISLWRERKGWKKLRTTILFSLIALAGLFLVFPRILDTVLFRGQTPRMSGFGSTDAGGLRWFDLLYFLLPSHIIIPFLSDEFPVGLYLGAFSSLLAAIGYLSFMKDRKVSFFSFGYLAIAVLIFEPLFFTDVLQRLPVFSIFHTIKRFLLPASFLLSFLAAYAFDRIRENQEIVRAKGFLKIISVFFIFSFLLVFFLNVFFATAEWTNPLWQEHTLTRLFTLLGKDVSRLTDSMEHYKAVFNLALRSVAQTLSFANWKFTFPYLLFPLSLFILWRHSAHKLSRRAFTLLALTLVFGNTFLVHAAQFGLYMSRSLLTDTPSYASVIAAQEKSPFDYYILSFLTGDAAYREVTFRVKGTPDETLGMLSELGVSNTNFFYTIPKIDGYEPFATTRQSHIWRDIIGNESLAISPEENVNEAIERKKLEFLSFLPLLSSYNVRYILSGYELKDSHLTPIPLEKKSKAPLFLYKNTAAVSRIYIPKRVSIVSEWSDDYFKTIDTTDTVIIECTECTSGISQKGNISLISYGNGSVVFDANSQEGIWVVIAQSDMPGWIGRIDGDSAYIHTANYLMQAIYIPAGHHQVALAYEGISRSILEEEGFGGLLKRIAE